MAQHVIRQILAMDDQSAAHVLTTVLESRPALAPTVVGFSVPDLTYPPAKALVERRAVGRIKSFNAQKGFGFVECPDLYEVFGNDVFIHHRQVGAFQAGDDVSFAVALNKDNKPQAYDLSDLSGHGKGHGAGSGGGMAGKGAGLLTTKGGGRQFGAANGYRNPSFQEAAAAAAGYQNRRPQMPARTTSAPAATKRKQGPKTPDVQEELGEYVGTVKSFSAKHGYGFIECAEIKDMGYNDVFVHHQQLGDNQVGSGVSFTAYLNSKGQPQGKDLSPMSPPKKMRSE